MSGGASPAWCLTGSQAARAGCLHGRSSVTSGRLAALCHHRSESERRWTHVLEPITAWSRCSFLAEMPRDSRDDAGGVCV